MSTLVAIAYPDPETAKQAMATLARLHKKRMIQLEDAVMAVNDGGKIKLDQGINLTSYGALNGAVWGGLLGMIFLTPISGLVIGVATGALAGKVSDYGIDDAFAKELCAQVTPGSAALFLLIRKAMTEKVLAEMKQFGGKVLRTNLSGNAEQRLQAAFAGQLA